MNPMIAQFEFDPFPVRKAEPGLVTAEQAPEALAHALATELARLAAQNPRSPWLATWCRVAAEARSEPDQNPELLQDLRNCLEDFAPEGHAFGAHRDNPSCLGFWRREDVL